MDTFEIKDDEINVEEIMRHIRENIKKRKESGLYNKKMEEMINETLQESVAIAEMNELKKNIDFINSKWDIRAEYAISSHRPILGRFLVWTRKLVHGEVKRYVDIIVGKQREFNDNVVRCINGLDARITDALSSTSRDTDARITDALSSTSKDTDSKINNALAAINIDLDNKIESKVNETVTNVSEDIEKKAWLANLLEKHIKSNITGSLPVTDNVMNYFLFEEKFRGTTEDIKNRQSIYVEYFKNCSHVLDIGCGRGEFLSLLNDNDIRAKGIDINEDMVLYCRKNSLDIEKNNALSYLKSLKDKSLDGIFSAQVVEHMQPEELINLIKLCYDKMIFGTYFIAETMNPMCLSIFATYFYMDLSHVKPVHPETIKFLLESVGFRDIQFKFFSMFPESSRLSKLPVANNLSSEERARLEVMNQNIDKLNSLLYGYLDYAVIAKK